MAHTECSFGNLGKREAHVQVRLDEIKACLLDFGPEPQWVVRRVCHFYILGTATGGGKIGSVSGDPDSDSQTSGVRQWNTYRFMREHMAGVR